MLLSFGGSSGVGADEDFEDELVNIIRIKCIQNYQKLLKLYDSDSPSTQQ